MASSSNPASERFAMIPGAIFSRMISDGLTLAERWVLAAILLCTNWKTGKTWPKVKRLQELTGLSEDTVTSAKTRLRKLGYIACEWRATKGGGQVIRVLFDRRGNPRTFPGHTTGHFPANLPRTSLPNPPAKSGTLPTESSSCSTGLQSQEQRQRTESKGTDLFLECKRLNNGKERLLLSEAFGRFQLSTAGAAFLNDKDIVGVWAQVQQEISNYHGHRVHRGLSCDFDGCVRLPAQKIDAMVGAKTSPIAYLAASLTDALGKEEDRAQRQRENQARSRKGGGGLATSGDFMRSLGDPPRGPA